MELRRLPAEEADVRRYVEALWLPYHRDLEETVERHTLADDEAIIEEEVAFRLNRLDSETYRAWVAVEPPDPGDAASERSLADVDGDLAGFVTTDIDESPDVFERSNRLVVGDLYVREPYRGTGLAHTLIERTKEHAREAGCAELTLTVDEDNKRARAFYDKLGFTTYRRELIAAVEKE